MIKKEDYQKFFTEHIDMKMYADLRRGVCCDGIKCDSCPLKLLSLQIGLSSMGGVDTLEGVPILYEGCLHRGCTKLLMLNNEYVAGHSQSCGVYNLKSKRRKISLTISE